jgi:hypothetical protein
MPEPLSVTAPRWREMFPDLLIPEGLTVDDLNEVAGLIHVWSDGGDEDFTGLYLAARIFETFQAAVSKNKRRG